MDPALLDNEPSAPGGSDPFWILAEDLDRTGSKVWVGAWTSIIRTADLMINEFGVDAPRGALIGELAETTEQRHPVAIAFSAHQPGGMVTAMCMAVDHSFHFYKISRSTWKMLREAKFDMRNVDFDTPEGKAVFEAVMRETKAEIEKVIGSPLQEEPE